MNFFAIKWALETVQSFVTRDDEPHNDDEFSLFQKHVHDNVTLTGFQSTIIPKLRILYNMSKRNLIEELYQELTTHNQLIKEEVLHLILSSILDMDTKSEKYDANIQNANIAIKLLNVFVKFHKKINANTAKDYDYNEVENKQENYGSITIFYVKIAKKEYTTTEFQIKNCFIANKWLMELYGVVSKSNQYNDENKAAYKNVYYNIMQLVNNEKKFLKSENFKDDQHFMFLKAKHMSKILLHLADWEKTNRPDGWNLNIPNFFKLTAMNKYNMLELLTKLQTDLKCPYINRIELLTIIFRYHRRFTKDYDAMYSIIKEAISESVITPEVYLYLN
ncbi:uncharacterized protein LOC112600748 [Melanaphis sacchari]|uniref:uncharacterized protein LOC112600748 n=1 Tax=Melanaphis sacchari TaxID=742174 RepID=UPI000DC14877|nr:uncharacterized protein LOC112600748 [Melanaphis sacchari]